MAPSPTVSVAIPVYNGAAHLVESITSVLAQTAMVAELKVYDNASDDDTVSLARTLLPREDVVVAEANLGAVHNFNLAARAASGDYFMWLAADDRAAPTFVQACSEELRRKPLAPACLTGIHFIAPDGTTVGRGSDPALESVDPGVRLRSFLRRSRWTEFYCLYRRDRLLASPLMTEEYGADVLLTWWFLLRDPLAVVTQPLLDYRVYPEKSVAEMAESLTPGRATSYWRKQRLWRRLRELTRGPGVDPRVGRTARRELLLALGHRAWLGHLAEDVFERWPITRRSARRVTDRARRRRTQAPGTVRG